MKRVAILETGASNVASLTMALHRIGVLSTEVRTAEEVLREESLIVPGVGAFGAVMNRLKPSVRRALVARVEAGKRTLGICLGMQIFAACSEESPGVVGLGAWKEGIRRFPSTVTVPQMGWNSLMPSKDSRWCTGGAAYFANAYYLPVCPEGWIPTWATWGIPFIAALERGDVVLCQFHPELSGAWGLSFLRRWCFQEATTGSEASPLRGRVRIIPCMDVRDGRVVKGVQFVNVRDAGDPAELASEYARQGADELVMLDISATPEGRTTACDTVRAIRRAVALPLTVGGGVATPADARRLLGAGADKVAINSAAVECPRRIADLSEQFGSQCVVLSLDAVQTPWGWEVVTRSGTHRTGQDAVVWAQAATALGAGEILLTSMDRDGTQSGYDCGLLRAVCEVVDVPVIASGGGAHPSHFQEAIGCGVLGLLAASIFHDAQTTVSSLKQTLQDRGAWL